MSIQARLEKLEDLYKDRYLGADHSHVAMCRKIDGIFYNRDGTKFVDNHPKDCPEIFILMYRGEEHREVPN